MNIQEVKNKVESTVRPQLEKARSEIRHILTQLGAKLDGESKLADIVTQIREKNPSLRQLARSIDLASYDTRKKLEWDTTMMTAFAKLKAEEALNTQIKPRLENYRQLAEARVEQIKVNVNELRARFVKA